MDDFPAELIVLGDRHSVILFHTSQAAEMNHLCVPCMKIGSDEGRGKKKKLLRQFSSKGPAVERKKVAVLTCRKLSFKGCRCFKGSRLLFEHRNCYLVLSKFFAVPAASSWRWKGISSAWLDTMAN